MRAVPSTLASPPRDAVLPLTIALLAALPLAVSACRGVTRGPLPASATGVMDASGDCSGVRMLVVRNPTVHDLRIVTGVDDRPSLSTLVQSEELGIARPGRSEFALTLPATRFYAVRVAGGGVQPSNQDYGRGTSPDAETVHFSVVCRPDPG